MLRGDLYLSLYMEHVDRLKERLDALRPLSQDYLARLWPMWDKDDALHVYASNAVEGSTMSLGETLAVLEDGITISGKPLREHLDIVQGQRAYVLMLKLAKDRAPITTSVIRALHRAVVGDVDIGGQWRDHAVYIRGSRHVPPNYIKIPDLIEVMIEAYTTASQTEHPVIVAAKLHLDLVTIHPFADGNGRTARLLGNLELIRRGFAPILIDKADRTTYFSVLERCQIANPPGIGDPTAFVAFVERHEQLSLHRYLSALEISEGISFVVSSCEVGIDPNATTRLD